MAESNTLVQKLMVNIGEFLGSKKTKGFLLGLFGLALSHYSGFTPEEQTKILVLAASYLGAQGAADIGKEKAKIESVSAPSAPAAPPA